MSVPSQTFTDETDDNYILRFSLTAPYITSTGYPIIHIRKIPRKKPMSEELMAAGMFDEKIKNYLIDQSINKGKSIVFAGPPGSGKTTALNWFLEDGYESSAEILVIQENDELFSSLLVRTYSLSGKRKVEKFHQQSHFQTQDVELLLLSTVNLLKILSTKWQTWQCVVQQTLLMIKRSA